MFVSPTQDMIRQARAEGYEFRMLPGISAEDCLFADLDLDPGLQGCQSYEASDFLIRPRRFDPSTPLILWQAGVIGYFDVIIRPSMRRLTPGARKGRHYIILISIPGYQ